MGSTGKPLIIDIHAHINAPDEVLAPFRDGPPPPSSGGGHRFKPCRAHHLFQWVSVKYLCG